MSNYYVATCRQGASKPFTQSSLQEGDNQASTPDGGSSKHDRDRGMNGASSSWQGAFRKGRDDGERPPLLRMEILSGPGSGREITIDDANAQVCHLFRPPDKQKNKDLLHPVFSFSISSPCSVIQAPC